MRDRETIDSELRRIALGRRSIREQGGQPSTQEVDELLDELLAHSTGATLVNAPSAPETPAVAAARPRHDTVTLLRPSGVLRRLGLVAALPLSLVAIAAAAIAIFAVRHQDSSAQPTEAPPPAASSPSRPVASPPARMAPPAPAPRIGVADTAFIAALKHEGVPIPSQDYVMAQGHAVCDFLAHQHNFSDAVGFVQRSSIWDADQSTHVTAGAIVAYCPQSLPSASNEMQPSYQDALSDLQAIEGKLRDIQGDLDNLPGHP
ncbi:DUF732 domain-containing protein [Mycobacterium intracellulare]|uniref:DUF732 domain-containing protein n=1 Tax=Mycobacterium intracellulare TaxID=1767 RepID=A0AAE4RG50_MYCIT|nr:DUF732 domain-containing protein [Mycobacterium intracellulare]ASW83963.1 hypothetical protein CKJ61_02990 [Mycobacterium intracellulare]MCA2253690.1 DUF732 domain-containing protein [Mycobacterium intracellulare]MCA2306761.1 DUF732 domain-containing protein [Mycobacterium intracellulare]MCA2320959.1 DUF732 domain-containing protein [Mycobacterium intracellulare]MCA2341306.1 DUF732 domain-containing protein [Mycobacterium intracellulare]